MLVHLERDFATLGYKVYFYEREPGGGTRVIELLSGGAVKWVDVADGASLPVSLMLPPDTLEALLREAEKVIPASHATERHLNDVITVRDRLLTLVEADAAEANKVIQQLR